MGKSAQLLLHTWLPDAMEGPTPVSALIHAATMVTAGVFMVCRLSPLIEYTTFTSNFIVIVGASTAFFAATVGLVQNDIKRVIAYSADKLPLSTQRKSGMLSVEPSWPRNTIQDNSADRNNMPVEIINALRSPKARCPKPHKIAPTRGAKRRMVSMSP